MEEHERKVVYGVGLPGIGAVLAAFFGILSFDAVKMAGVFAVGAGVIYFLLKRADNPFPSDDSSLLDDDALEWDECTDICEENLEQRLSGDHDINFRPESDDSEAIRLDKWDELIYYFRITYGPNNREVLAFVSASTGRFLGHKKVRYDQEVIDPFSYCPLVEEYREQQRRATMSYVGRDRRQRGQPRERLSLRDDDRESGERGSEQEAVEDGD